MQYTEIFSVVKKRKFHQKENDIFSYFCSKHRLLVHVGTVGVKNKKNRHTPVHPSFDIKMWGSRGYTLHGHVFLMLKMKV